MKKVDENLKKIEKDIEKKLAEKAKKLTRHRLWNK